MYRNTLIIGATGMMAGVAGYLAKDAQLVSFTARTAKSIDRLSATLNPLVRNVGLQLDWNQKNDLLASLSKHCKQEVYPDLVVAWLHKDRLGPEIIAELSIGQNIDFYQVRGSAAANPVKSTKLEIPMIKGLSYHEIVLGFQIQDGRSRWLTDAEITAGTIDAIENKPKKKIIGVVEPWEMRP